MPCTSQRIMLMQILLDKVASQLDPRLQIVFLCAGSGIDKHTSAFLAVSACRLICH